MKPNKGRLPTACSVKGEEDGAPRTYKAVHVILFSGWDSRKAIVGGPWPSAGGKPPTDWSISDPPKSWQIKEWELA